MFEISDVENVSETQENYLESDNWEDTGKLEVDNDLEWIDTEPDTSDWDDNPPICISESDLGSAIESANTDDLDSLRSLRDGIKDGNIEIVPDDDPPPELVLKLTR